MPHAQEINWKKVGHKGDKATQREEGAEADLSVYQPFIRQLGLMSAAGPGNPGFTEYARNDLGGFGSRS